MTNKIIIQKMWPSITCNTYTNLEQVSYTVIIVKCIHNKAKYTMNGQSWSLWYTNIVIHGILKYCYYNQNYSWYYISSIPEYESTSDFQEIILWKFDHNISPNP